MLNEAKSADEAAAVQQNIRTYKRCGTIGMMEDNDLDQLDLLPQKLKLKILSMFHAGYTGQTYYDYDNKLKSNDPITIVHFNDVYNLDSDTGGFPKFAAAIRSYRDRSPLIFFSGDAFNPSMMSTMMRGRHMVPFLNSLQIKTACVGNHDWDFGLDDFEILSGSTNFPWILSNLTTKYGDIIGGTQRYHVFEHQGHTIGVIGLIEYEWLQTCPLLALEDVQYTDFVRCAHAMVQLLRYKGVDLIIALTHMRGPNDEKLAREVDGLDLIMGGHDHHYPGFHNVGTSVVGKSGTDFREFSLITIEPCKTQESLITKPQATQGCLDIELDDANSSGMYHIPFKGGSTLHWERVDCSFFPPNPHIQHMVAEYSTRMESAMTKVIGAFSTPLESRFSKIRTQETNIGSYVADLMRMFTKSDIAMLNSGTLRADALVAAFEPFTLKTLFTLLPFPDELVVIELTGAGVIAALEAGYCMHPKLEGRFLQISGLQIELDTSCEPGSRVGNVKVKRWKQDDYEEIELDQTYRVVCKYYLAQGKDGFECLLGAKVLVDPESCPILPTMLSNQFEYLSFINHDKQPQVQQTIRQIAKIRTLDARRLKEKGFEKVKNRFYLSAHTENRIKFLNTQDTLN